MSERIKSLLQRVAASEGSASDSSSSSVDRDLRDRLPQRGNMASLEREIASEIASSLGRAGSKLEAALERAHATRAALEASTPGTPERRTLIECFDADRAQAERRLRDLLIQREAIGLRRHTDVHRRYLIPAPWPNEPESAT
jgi:hypothetical protein